MSDTYLVKDKLNAPVPVLSTKEGAGHVITVSATAVTNSIAFTQPVITLYSTTDAFYTQGVSAGITANTSTSHFLPAGTIVDLSNLKNGRFQKTHISLIQSTASGTVYISERE